MNKTFILACAMLVNTMAFAYKGNITKEDLFEDNTEEQIIKDEKEQVKIQNPDINVQRFDSLFNKWQSDNEVSLFIDSYSVCEHSTLTSDSVYKARLKNLASPVYLPYNQILKKYLVSYTTTNKEVISTALTRAKYYFPIIEQELILNDLPLELRMVPIVESLLRPTATSRVGATGIWQFMYYTGKMYKLEITSFLDQRRDPVASTKAACMFLKDLYDIYGDWTLALAAYNCGPGNVNKAIRRAEGKVENFWDIYPYLPSETRSYVPLIVAANYACNYHLQHQIEAKDENIFLLTDTVHINKLTHFNQISTTIDAPLEMLRALNPQYKKDIIPAVEKPYTLVLPQDYITKYFDSEEQIMAKDTMFLAKYIKEPSLKKMELLAATTIHRVKSGDTLSGIAQKYRTSVSNLMKWNKLKKNSVLRIGQKIEIHK
ncbi:MAG: transglycosylase SLT domain-containing protein [Rikenellaceae bacterium]